MGSSLPTSTGWLKNVTLPRTVNPESEIHRELIPNESPEQTGQESPVKAGAVAVNPDSLMHRELITKEPPEEKHLGKESPVKAGAVAKESPEEKHLGQESPVKAGAVAKESPEEMHRAVITKESPEENHHEPPQPTAQESHPGAVAVNPQSEMHRVVMTQESPVNAGAVAVNIHDPHPAPREAAREISSFSWIAQNLMQASRFLAGLIAFVESWEAFPQLSDARAFLLPKLVAVKTIVNRLLLVLGV